MSEPRSEAEEDVDTEELADDGYSYLLLVIPPVTGALLALNVGLFVWMAVCGIPLYHPDAESLIPWGASYGPLVRDGEWWRLLTSTFVHSGIPHLLFNMLPLLCVGLVLEPLLGSARFLLLFLASALAGSAASLLWHFNAVSTGASGAVFGLAGALFSLIVQFRPTLDPQEFRHQLKGALAFLAYSAFFGLKQPNIDLAAHVGGLLTGVLLIALGLARARLTDSAPSTE